MKYLSSVIHNQSGLLHSRERKCSCQFYLVLSVCYIPSAKCYLNSRVVRTQAIRVITWLKDHTTYWIEIRAIINNLLYCTIVTGSIVKVKGLTLLMSQLLSHFINAVQIFCIFCGKETIFAERKEKMFTGSLLAERHETIATLVHY